MPARSLRIVCSSLALVLLAACSASPGAPRAPTEQAAIPAPPAKVPPGPRRIATSDGVELHVDVAGQGPPCLYVHGGPGQGSQSFQRMRGDRLEGALTMVYIDQRGSGRSAEAADYSLDRVVADLDEVRAALGQEQVYLLAHSFGGILALRYAERYPARVRGLVLANTTLWFPHSLRAQLAYIREQIGDGSPLPEVSDLTEVRAAYDRARERLSHKQEYVPLLAADVQTMRTMREVDAAPPRNRAFGAHVQIDEGSEYAADFTPRTASVRAPVLVITGDRDHAIGPDHVRLFRFPRQTVVHIDGSHLLYYENSDDFVAAVRGWLSAASPASSGA